MTTLESIIIASFSISIISLAGALLLFWRQIWVENISMYLVSFAAGTMLAVAFLDLLPEAAGEASDISSIFVAVFAGIISFFIIERFVLWYHHHDSSHGTKPAALLILVGDSFHNLLDGVAIAAAFIANPGLGVVTTLAMAAHEIPQEVADFGVLVHSGMKKQKALAFNLLTALTAMIGAVAAYYFLENIAGTLPFLLAFTAGMFTYIACSDLIPELHKDAKDQRSWAQLIPFIAGIAILWGLVRILE